MRIAAFITLLIGGISTSTAHADPPATHDYSRFSDGPRWVPTPRGASLARAERLGLGDRRAARRLLRRSPPDAWTRAAPGDPGGRLLWPVDEGRYVRGFGYVRRTRPDLLHRGVDIAAEPGSVVRAAADGIVAYSDNRIRGYGNCVIIVHSNGWVTLYAHNQRTTVQPGWRVRRGERIALVGNTGISRGPHLHFELRVEGRAVSPIVRFDRGPRWVQRVAQRAAAAGRVPPPTLRPADRAVPPPLAGNSRGEGARSRPAAPGPALGSPRLVRALMHGRHEHVPNEIPGRRFRNLLWPARGGQLANSSRRGAAIRTEPGTPIRAAADGLVVFVGDLGRRTNAVFVLHPGGWLTGYRGVAEAVTVGDAVQRGQWLGRAHGSRVAFEWWEEGSRRNPEPSLVHTPSAD